MGRVDTPVFLNKQWILEVDFVVCMRVDCESIYHLRALLFRYRDSSDTSYTLRKAISEMGDREFSASVVTI